MENNGTQWKACYGHGLVLTETEFSKFLNAYQRKCQDEKLKDILEDVLEDNLQIEDVMLTGADKSLFTIHETYDGIQGFRLIPYIRRDRINKDELESPAFAKENAHVYILNSDLEIDGVHYFETRRSYESYSDLVHEFQAKIAPYLSINFDWDAHVGRYLYACPIED